MSGESLVDECESSGAGVAECLFSDVMGFGSNGPVNDDVVALQSRLLSGCRCQCRELECWREGLLFIILFQGRGFCSPPVSCFLCVSGFGMGLGMGNRLRGYGGRR